jgi:hypothetical protein
MKSETQKESYRANTCECKLQKWYVQSDNLRRCDIWGLVYDAKARARLGEKEYRCTVHNFSRLGKAARGR